MKKVINIIICMMSSGLFMPLLTIAKDKGIQLTIYNGNFAVIKEDLRLKLKKGENEIRVTDITFHLDPESVILRDKKNPNSIKVLEQNFEGDPLSQNLLLLRNEGKIIEFEVYDPETKGNKIKKAKIIRSGYVPHSQAYDRYGRNYTSRQSAYVRSGGNIPIIEMDGKLRFSLPGTPLFDSIDTDYFLKPTLLWQLWSDKAASYDLEFSYITGGMKWEATYNAIFPEKGDNLDISGWVTIDNQSGKEFKEAKVKLMAGDVSKLKQGGFGGNINGMRYLKEKSTSGQQVKEKAFDEYHLYDLKRKLRLRDREVKQVEFIRALNIKADRFYVYDGVSIGRNYRHYTGSSRRDNESYGTECNPKVWVMMEFKNSKQNNLGMPLPKGKIKLYRRDDDNRNEFIGEDVIDHTPQNEKVRVYLGNAFDIKGERKQVAFKKDRNQREIYESFEIKLRNHKKEEKEVRVVEHLYRWANWEIKKSSDEYTKTDSRTIEFRVKLKPEEERIINYIVRYWGSYWW